MLVSVNTATESAVTVTLKDAPDGVHKCIGVSVGSTGAITRLDPVSTRSLIAGLVALLDEVETRNCEIKGEDTNVA